MGKVGKFSTRFIYFPLAPNFSLVSIVGVAYMRYQPKTTNEKILRYPFYMNLGRGWCSTVIWKKIEALYLFIKNNERDMAGKTAAIFGVNIAN